MSDRGYLIRDQQALHFVTFAVVQWVDVFTRAEYADVLVDSLKFCRQHKGLNIHAWCIMSNHVHLIVSAKEGHFLSGLLRDLKKFTSSSIISAIKNNTRESRRNWMLWIFSKAGEENHRNHEYQFWQQTNHPVECSTMKILDSRMKYLHENPVRANIVRYEADYIYSSGIDYYANGKGLIEIDRV